jgi:hypothetical protein
MPWQNVGSPFIVISPANGIFLVYELPGPELGTLIASIAPTAGVDQYGNAYGAGVAAYITINTTVFMVQLNDNLPAVGTEGAGLAINAISGSLTAAYAPGGIFGQVGQNPSQATLDTAEVWMTSGQSTASDIPALLVLDSADTIGYSNGGNLQSTAIWNEFAGALYIDGGPASASSIGQAGLGLGAGQTSQVPQVYCSTDETVYNFGKQWAVSTSGVVLNSATTPTVIHSVNVQAPGNYHFRCLLFIVANAAAGTFSIGWAGSAGVVSGSNRANILTGASPTTWTITVGAMPPLITSTTMTGAGEHFWYEAEGEFTVTTNGVLQVRGQISTTGDTATVATGSMTFIELMNAT